MKENKFVSNGNTFVVVKKPKVNVKELIKKRKKK